MQSFLFLIVLFLVLLRNNCAGEVGVEDGDAMYATSDGDTGGRTAESAEEEWLNDNDFTRDEGNSSKGFRNTTKQEDEDEEAKLAYEKELRAKQAEAARQRKIRERHEEGVHAVKRTIDASNSDSCDWKSQPISFIKGEVCGSHYKVLGIDRKGQLLDKSGLKRKYRQMSLHLHPDKNPAENAEDAFTVLQDAYNCIVDDECKANYDSRLMAQETEIAWRRRQFKDEMIERTVVALNHAHYYISLAANHIYNVGMNFWDMMGDWQVTIFDESYPIGKPVAILALLWKGQFLLKIHALSYVVIRVNYEIAKAKGWAN